MKIVFIGGRDIHILGGIENYTLNLATQLASFGHQIIVYCESDHNACESVNGFEVRYVKGPKSNLICKPWVSLLATLRTVFKEKDVSLIHYNAWPPSLWAWIASLAGIPSLMEGHGLEWKRSKYGPIARRILKLMEGVTARCNKNLVMCSMDQVRYFREEYGRQAVCIPGAINLPSARAGAGSNILERFDLQREKYFLFLGRLVPEKNPDCLIRAFEKSQLTGYKLVIAGANDALPDYVASLKELSRSHDVIFTGAVYGPDKDCLLANSFAFCLPSTVEGLSIVLMEAMSFRLRIIASNIEANRELLQGNALYVEPEADEDLARALKQAAQGGIPATFAQQNYLTLQEKYIWPKVARAYLDYISGICTSKL